MIPVTRLGTSCATGNETSLAKCEEYDTDERHCTHHNYDAYIKCVPKQSPHGKVPREYCEVPAAMATHSDKKHKEDDKHHKDKHKDDKHEKVPLVRETCDGAARLTSYPTGMVEVYDFTNGGWGSVCGLSFRKNISEGPSLLCRELGYAEGAISVRTLDRSHDKHDKHLPVALIAPQCTGSEAALVECPADTEVKEGDCKNHKYDAEVTCKGERTLRPGKEEGDLYAYPNQTDCATVAIAMQHIQDRKDHELSERARLGKVSADDFDFHIDQCTGFSRKEPWMGDYSNDDWYCPPEDLEPTPEDRNPWCPDKYLQDAWMFWPFVPQNRTLRQPECRTVCLPSLFKKIASKHGLSYGSTCYEKGCTRPIGGFVKLGVHAYRYACDDVEEEQWPEGVEPED